MLNACDHFQRIPWKLHSLLLQGWDLWRTWNFRSSNKMVSGWIPLGNQICQWKIPIAQRQSKQKGIGMVHFQFKYTKACTKVCMYVCMHACMYIYIYNMYIGWCCTFQFHYSFLRDVLYVENNPSRRDTVGRCRVTPTLFNRNCRWRTSHFTTFLGVYNRNWEVPFCNGWCSSIFSPRFCGWNTIRACGRERVRPSVTRPKPQSAGS